MNTLTETLEAIRSLWAEWFGFPAGQKAILAAMSRGQKPLPSASQTTNREEVTCVKH